MKTVLAWPLRGTLAATLVCLALSGCLSTPKLTLSLNQEVLLPAPSGPFAVGRTERHLVDNSRPALPGSPTPREFVVTVYYPAIPAAGASPGPYAEDALLKAYADERLTEGSLAGLRLARPHAYPEAPLVSKGRFPLVLFSPGGGEQPLFYTTMLEAVASHGYIVVAVPEPFDTPVLLLPDGRKLTPADLEAWSESNPVAKKAVGGDAVAQAEVGLLLRDNRAYDLSFVLQNAELRSWADDRTAVFGHSWGGASAVRVAQLDRRVQAVLDLDGRLDTMMPEGSSPPLVPTLLLETDNIDVETKVLPELARLYAFDLGFLEANPALVALKVAGTTHQSLQTDAMFLAPYLSLQGEPVLLFAPSTSAQRLAQVLTTVVVAFLDQALAKEGPPFDPAAYLAGELARWPEVSDVRAEK